MSQIPAPRNRTFGRQAETISQYMSKGRPLLVEGRLRYRQWTTEDGQKRSKLRVVADRVQFLGGPGGGDGGGRRDGLAHTPPGLMPPQPR